MHKLNYGTVRELQRLQRQAASLATRNPKHARLAIFLAGLIKLEGGAL